MPIDNITGLKARVPGGKYAMTRAIAARAQQLQNGALPVTEVKVANPITVAIEEVLQGKINFQLKDGPALIAEENAAQEAAQAAQTAVEESLSAAAAENPEIADATSDGA